MRSLLSITVNGEPRSEVALATPQPIPDLDFLSLRYVSGRGPGFTATNADYVDGTYRFSPLPPRTGDPGTYRVAAVDIIYTDGSRTMTELAGSIDIDVAALPKRPEHRPRFTAR